MASPKLIVLITLLVLYKYNTIHEKHYCLTVEEYLLPETQSLN